MNEEPREKSVLSPILSQADKSFMYNINNFIQEELRVIESVSSNLDQASVLKEKYQVFKQAFGNVIIFILQFFLNYLIKYDSIIKDNKSCSSV